MARLLWLPDVLHGAGLTVHLVDGWRERGSSTFTPKGLICHATAGSRTSTDAGEIRVLLEGSETAPAPIAQLYLGRNGHWHVVASGRCNHARTGWGGPLEGLGNTNLIGVEAANDNKGEPWPAVQVDAYQRGVAAICRRMGWTAGRNIAAHREHQPGAKTDPHGIDMKKFRTRVTALLNGEDDDMPTAEEIAKAVWAYPLPRQKEAPAPAGTMLANGFDRTISAQHAALRTEQIVTKLAEVNPDLSDDDLARIRAVVDEQLAAAGPGLAASLAPQLVTAVREELGDLDDERVTTAVERGIRRVLGELDEPAEGQS